MLPLEQELAALHKPLLRFAKLQLRDEAAAEDVVPATLLAILEKPAALQRRRAALSRPRRARLYSRVCSLTVPASRTASRIGGDNRAMDLRQRALELLCFAEPLTKASGTRRAFDDATALTIDAAAALPEPAGLPGRPTRPLLVSPAQVPRRSLHTAHGRAALLHAVAHIEFNAINLALDAVWRFRGMPDGYYRDWARVAAEEAQHFALLNEHLATLGHAYGDFDAHDGLWTMVEKTKHDITARMALVPRTLEARGLDATPPMQAKLAQAGDMRAAEILGVILRDEVGHVAIGNRWYRWLCSRDGQDPIAHFEQLLVTHDAPRPKPPFNLDARRRAGFDDEDLARLVAPTPARH